MQICWQSVEGCSPRPVRCSRIAIRFEVQPSVFSVRLQMATAHDSEIKSLNGLIKASLNMSLGLHLAFRGLKETLKDSIKTLKGLNQGLNGFMQILSTKNISSRGEALSQRLASKRPAWPSRGPL